VIDNEHRKEVYLYLMQFHLVTLTYDSVTLKGY